MSEDNNQEQNAPEGGAEAANGSAPSLNILAQYVKDLSFENPLAPAAAKAQDGGPDVDIRINVNGRHLQENDYEVVLHFKVETKSGDETSFIVELLYGAVFRIQNVPEQDLKPVLLIEAPRQIFPFARRILADVTRDGGFPPLLLDPINFVALYQQNEAAAQQAEAEQQDKKPDA
ncbi:MAG: protein-export chaperone SecB [Parvibaculales bacterium]